MYRKLKFNRRHDRIVRELINSGGFVIGSTGRLIGRSIQGALDIPWIFFHNDGRKKFCAWWNGVFCGKFSIIPTNCRFNCWKTVFKPPTIKSVFECYDIMSATRLPGKIGVDRRDYTFGPYAGFVYADTLEEGREYYKITRNLLPDNVSVILKRGCTEMERLIPSDKWDVVSTAELEYERQLHDLFEFTEYDFPQSDWHKAKIKEAWIRHAIAIGDPTAQETAEKYSGDPNIWKKLVVTAVTYHDMPQETEKPKVVKLPKKRKKP